LIEHDQRIADGIDRYGWVVATDRVLPLEQILGKADGWKTLGVDLKEANSRDGAAAEVIGDGSGCPKGIVAPHGVDEARAAGFDTRSRGGLRGVGREAARRVEGEVLSEQHRVGGRRVDDAPDTDLTFIRKLVADEEARQAG